MFQIAFSPYAEWWVWLKPRGLDWLLTLTIPSDMKKWIAFVSNNLDERTKVEQDLKKSGASEASARKDFFHYLFDAKDPETGKLGYDLGELYGECELLTIAGSDTTAITFAATTFYLARNPKMQDKLAREIRSTFPSYDEIVAGPKLHSCKYLKAFINETLRTTPPVPADLAREVLPGGTTVEGHFFPKDVQVSTSLYCLSHNKDVYDKPFTFRPERWLDNTEDPDGDPSEKVALSEAGFCAFSMGTRGCVGKNMAWMEMLLVVAKLIYRFELKQDASNNLGGGKVDGPVGHQDPNRYQFHDAFISLRDGPMVQFKKRV